MRGVICGEGVLRISCGNVGVACDPACGVVGLDVGVLRDIGGVVCGEGVGVSSPTCVGVQLSSEPLLKVTWSVAGISLVDCDCMVDVGSDDIGETEHSCVMWEEVIVCGSVPHDGCDNELVSS